MLIDKALDAEKRKDVELAASLYEEAIREEQCPSLDCFINLLLIYFIANDPGERKAFGLSLEFTNQGNNRIADLIAKAKECYPNSQELLFWENYIHFILDDDPKHSEVQARFSSQKETLIPFFYFYNPNISNHFLGEAEQLYKQVEEGKTCKERYIKSILEGHRKRRSFGKKNEV